MTEEKRLLLESLPHYRSRILQRLTGAQRECALAYLLGTVERSCIYRETGGTIDARRCVARAVRYALRNR